MSKRNAQSQPQQSGRARAATLTQATSSPSPTSRAAIGNQALQALYQSRAHPTTNSNAEAPAIVSQVIGGAGSALDPSVRGEMEGRFGRDFGAVRVHTELSAAESARAVDANAYTVGNHIVFDEGKYAPHSGAGRRLLAHELAHVVQQGGAGTPPGMTSAGPTLAASGTSVQREVHDCAPVPRDQLDQQYQDALVAAFRSGNWEAAAQKLNQYNREDIQARLAELTPAEISYLHEGALANNCVGPGSAIAQMTDPASQTDPRGAPAAPGPPGKTLALGTKVIGDVQRLQQEGASIDTARGVAFQQLGLNVSAGPAASTPTTEERQAAVTKIAAAMAGIIVPEPSMLSEGKLAHLAIGAFYKALNQPTLVDPSLITIIRALKLSKAAYDRLYAQLPEELLESLKIRPDIVDLGKLEIYEIKSFDSAARAVPEMLDYIELLESFEIPGIGKNFTFSPGSPSNPGTQGILQSPEGWVVFCCPWPGAIIYRMLLPMENPRSALERLKNEVVGTSSMMIGVESITGVSIALVASYESLIPLLTDAARLVGQAARTASALIPTPAP